MANMCCATSKQPLSVNNRSRAPGAPSERFLMQRPLHQLSLQQPCNISANASVIENGRRHFEVAGLDARLIRATSSLRPQFGVHVHRRLASRR